MWNFTSCIICMMYTFCFDHLFTVLCVHTPYTAGWLRTFEDYYRRQTRNILTLMTDALSADSRRKFVWAEISYLDLWWNEQSEHKKEQFRRFIVQFHIIIYNHVVPVVCRHTYMYVLCCVCSTYMCCNLQGVTLTLCSQLLLYLNCLPGCHRMSL